MTEAIMQTILEASFTAGIAAMVVILLRIPMKKLPKRWSYLLWAVVFFRCLCPFSAESRVSLFNAVPEQSIELREFLPEAAEAEPEEYTAPEIPPTASVSEDHSYFPDAYDSPYIDHSGNRNAGFNVTSAYTLPAKRFPIEKIPAENVSSEGSAEEPVNWAEILFPIWRRERRQCFCMPSFPTSDL